jgi:hypothetical protein
MLIRTDGFSHFAAVEVCGDNAQSGNGVDLNPANASSDPSIAAVGDDTNVNLVLKGKGTGAAQAALGAAITSPGGVCGALTDSSANASGTVQNTEYTLNSVTIPANAFNKNGRSVQVEAWGTLAANANAKNLKIYFGATAVATVTGSTANGKDYCITLSVVRTGASTQSGVGNIQIDTGVAPTMTVNAALAETDTAAIVIAVKSANTAAAAASATGKGMIASFGN